jgi:hypothetical protein
MSVAAEKQGRPAATAGYSGTPLWRKLGLAPGMRVWLRHAPPGYWALCGFDSAGITLATANARSIDFGHVFAHRRSVAEQELARALCKLDERAMLWLSWPKKASGVTTDLNEDTLRELALPHGLVDVKVCAVDAVWSGLKFVWRRSERKTKQ